MDIDQLISLNMEECTITFHINAMSSDYKKLLKMVLQQLIFCTTPTPRTLYFGPKIMELLDTESIKTGKYMRDGILFNMEEETMTFYTKEMHPDDKQAVKDIRIQMFAMLESLFSFANPQMPNPPQSELTSKIIELLNI
uniref:Uncharacterized protein n=1 Tax=Marseillevirus LCMAC102 TaxID=2506603 RepID=A0A481YUM0_9VIRU|nr:MAG: hypothetical protein LCMAC102_00180 [Marseillevirus LCMAC102]